MRVHANFAEYVPFALLLMALAESMAPPHLLVASRRAVARRRAPAACLRRLAVPPIMRYRVYGMWLTFAALGLAALICLSLSALFLAV